jgi:hypothetical protein
MTEEKRVSRRSKLAAERRVIRRGGRRFKKEIVPPGARLDLRLDLFAEAKLFEKPSFLPM